MKKAFLLPMACAAALTATANADYQYQPLVTGLVSVAENTGVPTADGGTWTTANVDLAPADGGGIEFDTDEVLQLNIDTVPEDTNTFVTIDVEVSLINVQELPDISGKAAQTAFAVSNDYCYAWTGSAWQQLDAVPGGTAPSYPTNLTVVIDYRSTKTASFSIGGTSLGSVTLSTTSNNVAGIGFGGSGILKKADAKLMLGVAEYKGVKYGTLAEAVAAANAAGGSAAIDILRDPLEGDTATVAEGVSVTVTPTTTQLGEGVSGTYSVPVSISGAEVALPASIASNKEIVDQSPSGDSISVTIRTATSVITSAAPDGSKALSHASEKLHNFLNTWAKAAYDDANASPASIAAAISTNGVNNLPLYQSYALGITPEASVKPVAAASGDSDSDKITLEIPAIKAASPSGDYTIKLVADGVTDAVSTDKGVVKVPLATGSYDVKIVFE